MEDSVDARHGCYTDHGISGYGVVAKLRREEPMSPPLVKKMAEEMMVSIAEKCRESGAKAIGHIKSHLLTKKGTIKADTIGVFEKAYAEGDIRYPVRELLLTVNSIAQGIPEQAVKSATMEGIHDAAGKSGLTVVKEKEHAYFDKFDFEENQEAFLQKLEEQF